MPPAGNACVSAAAPACEKLQGKLKGVQLADVLRTE